MNNKARYKYFNLLVRSIIGLTALVVIFYKLEDSFFDKFYELKNQKINFLYVLLAFLLTFLNWGIETIKWKKLVSKNDIIAFLKAYKIVLTGITLSLITPNRVGEIPARAYLLGNKSTLKYTIYGTFMGAFSQMIITVVFGVCGIFFTLNWLNIILPKSLLTLLILIVIGFVVVFFYSDNLKKVLLKLFNKDLDLEFTHKQHIQAMFFSLIRYAVFVLQYFLLLEAFGVHFTNFMSFWLIPVCFFIASTIPTFLISEIGVRSSVAIFIFGVLNQNDVAIISASILLWTINIAIPAVVGVFFIKQLKIVA